MPLSVENLEDQTKYRQMLAISYNNLIPFIFDQLRQKTVLMVFFWATCILFLGFAVIIRFNISGFFPVNKILSHTILGAVIFPVLIIPVHEVLHIIPYFLSGARTIRIGMDLKQYLFYVTAHRYVATPGQFIIVAVIPFIIISVIFTLLIIILPGLWKWSLSLFLFAHTTMCAGDFALLNFYYLNRDKKIYTWDDADQKMAYFYEELS